jgi:uncharacterized membrane protein YkoI
MTQRIALIVSAVLTAFLLVIGGAVAARLSSSPQPAEAAPVATTAPNSTPVPAPDINAQVEAIIQERETQYRALIQQANDRLQQAYEQQAAAQAAANQAAARAATVNTRSTAPAAQAAPAVAVSADSAAAIASGVAYNNQAMVRAPELVLFQGQVAYEVVFKHGSIYVDANSGQVLFNGTTNRPSNKQTASASNGNHESDHGDHESGHDD